jgi:hypothetical protein
MPQGRKPQRAQRKRRSQNEKNGIRKPQRTQRAQRKRRSESNSLILPFLHGFHRGKLCRGMALLLFGNLSSSLCSR